MSLRSVEKKKNRQTVKVISIAENTDGFIRKSDEVQKKISESKTGKTRVLPGVSGIDRLTRE